MLFVEYTYFFGVLKVDTQVSSGDRPKIPKLPLERQVNLKIPKSSIVNVV